MRRLNHNRCIGAEYLDSTDASIFPTILTGNTSAPTMMVGEKCADLVMRSRNASPSAAEFALAEV